jgi:uncharacterized protein (DUF1800 family)
MSVVLPVDAGPRTVTHALNRVAYGPRPGDVRRVLAQGLAAWIDEQLNPVADPNVDARLSGFPTLGYSVPQVVANANVDDNSLTQVQNELMSAKLIRAVHSRNQLQEVLVDFWFNHFNVYLPDDFLRMSTAAYERDAIRPNVLGKFKDLLRATANHVAMMFYLDNYLSTISRFDRSGRLIAGLNENYGRESMELHTVGVDAGYTQEHVFDAARCFTGWGIDNVNTGGNFQYRSNNHDTGSKYVFGLTVAAGGQKDDGDRLLDYLAAHPSTARFISKKLAQRFVADDPPAALIDRCAATFQATDGDIREVLSTLFGSFEFWAEANGDGKPRTPIELVVSALRAADAQVANADTIRNLIANMGMPLYQCIPPTGYSNRGADWLNPSSHLNRMNFALDLAAGRIGGVTVDLPSTVRRMSGVPEDPRSVANVMNTEVLGRRLSREALQTVTRVAVGTTPSVAAKVVGLCLASAPMQVR